MKKLTSEALKAAGRSSRAWLDENGLRRRANPKPSLRNTPGQLDLLLVRGGVK